MRLQTRGAPSGCPGDTHMNESGLAAGTSRSEENADIDAGPLHDSLLDAQRQALEMVVRGTPLSEVLAFLTAIVESHAGGDVVAAILLLDRNGILRTGAAPSLPHEYNQAINGIKACKDLGTCAAAAATGEVVVTPDIAADVKWHTIKHLPLGLGLVAAWSQPILARDGRVLGTFGTYFRALRAPTERERRLVGIVSHTAALAIERKEAKDASEQQRRILDATLDAAEMGTWRYTLGDGISTMSPRAQALYGLDSPSITFDDAGIAALLHPDDIVSRAERLAEVCAPGGEGRYTMEYRVRRRAGGWRWLNVWGVVEFEGEGEERRAVAIVGASRDITEIKKAEQRQKLLVDELNHRVKNTLAIIQAISAQTLRETPEPSAFKAAFTARLNALARGHALLTKGLWRAASLHDIAATTLDPFGGDKIEDAISIDGPAVAIEPNSAVTLCLVLHELATNAAKHGSLSKPGGRISLAWKKTAGRVGAPPNIELMWRERGGPPVVKPLRRGFGSRLITASAEQFGGDVTLAYEPAGLECTFRFPLSETAAEH